jgi:uncharacterized protein YkwD
MPFAISRRAPTRLGLVLVAVGALALAAGCAPLKSSAPASGAYGSLNGFRGYFGAGPVGPCASLERAAQALANDLSAHGLPAGHRGTLGQRVAGYGSANVGEVAVAQRPTIEAALDAFMSSGAHAGILLDHYQHAGIGHAPVGNYWVITFGSGGRC